MFYVMVRACIDLVYPIVWAKSRERACSELVYPLVWAKSGELSRREVKGSALEPLTKKPLSGVQNGTKLHKRNFFSQQFFNENRDTSVVGMTAIKDSETCPELDSA